MDIEAFKALVKDAGGYDNITQLVFDNAIHVKFVQKPEEDKLKESDFVNLGGTWFFKENTKFRDNVDFDYTVDSVIYHPMECLQAVITCKTPERIDILTMSDMLASISG